MSKTFTDVTVFMTAAGQSIPPFNANRSDQSDLYMKLIQEAGELSDSICKSKDIRDDIGDMMVVLINIMTRNNLSMEECLEVAYDDIKDRKGRMIDGIFVKEADL